WTRRSNGTLMPLDSPGPRPSNSAEGSRRTWIVYLLLGLFAALLFSRSGPSGTHIAYSDFKQKLAAGQIAEVEIGKERIRATPSDDKAKNRGERWITMRVEDPDLVKELEAKKVPFGGMRSEEHTSELQSLAYLVCRLL